MSDTNVLKVADVVTGPRRATVSKEAFYSGVIAGAAAGKTPAQVAADLGMEVLSFNQRLVQMRKEVKALNKVMPKLADARTKGNATGRKAKPLSDSILSALMNASESISTDAPTE
jgi:hypothetical protein